MTLLGHINDIDDDSSKGFSVGEDRLFAVKKGGELVIYRNKCPHLGVELNWLEDQFLDSEGALIHCTTHGALFLIEDGSCVAGPCLGKSLETVKFDLIEGEIYLR
ncbi:MAG: nitrite reductase/ring-hydroxylating ferredoxin subunit [Paraglaciecola psychrophila]|jgi:nitrite reductase/ring-hydroxylating ferredoxin subunit